MADTEVNIQTSWVDFPSGSDTIQAYLAQPAAPGPYSAMVQVHENLGMTEHRCDVAERIARQGCLTLTPNLYSRIGGKPPQDFTTPEERRRKAFLAAPDEQVVQDLLAAHAYLQTRSDILPDRIGIIGFCMGGSLALATVCRGNAFKLFIDFYGALTKRAELTEDWTAVSYLPLVPDLKCPIQIHIGTQDQVISNDEISEFERLLKEHGKDYQIHRYPGAKHAFHDNTIPLYSPENAALAQERAFAYLRERL